MIITCAQFAVVIVLAQVPLEWLQVLDMLDKKKKERVTHMTRSAFVKQAGECGVVKDDMDCLLFYLNQLGEALWVNTDALRDLVILVRWLICCLLAQRDLHCCRMSNGSSRP